LSSFLINQAKANLHGVTPAGEKIVSFVRGLLTMFLPWSGDHSGTLKNSHPGVPPRAKLHGAGTMFQTFVLEFLAFFSDRQ